MSEDCEYYFSITNPTEEEMEEIRICKMYLEDELDKKDSYIEDYEMQIQDLNEKILEENDYDSGDNISSSLLLVLIIASCILCFILNRK